MFDASAGFVLAGASVYWGLVIFCVLISIVERRGINFGSGLVPNEVGGEGWLTRDFWERWRVRDGVRDATIGGG